MRSCIVWNVDNSASCNVTVMATNYNTNMYDVRLPPPGREVIIIRDGHKLRVEYVGSMDAIFHRYTVDLCR